MSVPKSYRSMAEFEREELRPSFKIGFSLDDSTNETMMHTQNDLLFDDTVDEYDSADD